jgi:hypothetical protein
MRPAKAINPQTMGPPKARDRPPIQCFLPPCAAVFDGVFSFFQCMHNPGKGCLQRQAAWLLLQRRIQFLRVPADASATVSVASSAAGRRTGNGFREFCEKVFRPFSSQWNRSAGCQAAPACRQPAPWRCTPATCPPSTSVSFTSAEPFANPATPPLPSPTIV